MRMSSGLQIPLVLEFKLWSLAERYTLLAPALSSCSSLTLNSWDGRWLGYTGCAYGRLRERRVCPFQNRECTWLVDCTGADICMLPGRQILPVENQLLLSILCSAPYILLGWLTLGRFATLSGCLQADLCSVLVLGIKYWQFFFLSNLSLGFSLFQLLNFKKSQFEKVQLWWLHRQLFFLWMWKVLHYCLCLWNFAHSAPFLALSH